MGFLVKVAVDSIHHLSVGRLARTASCWHHSGISAKNQVSEGTKSSATARQMLTSAIIPAKPRLGEERLWLADAEDTAAKTFCCVHSSIGQR